MAKHEYVIRWCEHGETVDGMDSTRGCSGCVNGICGAALASEPLPLTQPRRISPEVWCSITGAALGLIAALALVHRLGIF